VRAGEFANEIERRLLALEQAVQGERHVREQAILEALQDEIGRVRDHAIALAARHMEPAAVGELVGEDANAVLRNAALEVLERQGSYALPTLLDMARGNDPEIAMFAVQVLARIRETAAAPTLLGLLDHFDENLVLAVIEALAAVGARSAVPDLIAELRDGGVWRQLAAVQALGELGDPRGVPALLDALSNEMLTEPAAEALGRIGALDCLEPLLELLREPRAARLRDRILRAAAMTIAAHGPERVAEIVERFRQAATAGDLPGGLPAYLETVVAGDDTESSRAAASVALALGLDELFPAVLLRAHRRDDRAWVHQLLRRHREQLNRLRERLLDDVDPRVRSATLQCGCLDPTATPLVLRRLSDPNLLVRTAACRAAGELRTTAAVPALLQCFSNGEGEDRDAAMDALSRMPADALEPLREHLETGDPQRKVGALEAVRASRCERFVDEVVALLNAGVPEVRLAAARAAGVLKGVDHTRHLMPLLRDEDSAVRAEALEALADRRHPGLVEQLVRMLGNDDPVRYHAIRALGKLAAPEGAEPLAELFRAAEPHERIEILSALTRIAPQWITTFLQERFEEDGPETRRLAAECLVRLAVPNDLPLVLRLAQDPDWSVRSYAAWGLGRLGLAAGRETLELLTRDVEPLVARTARDALGRLRDR
jgi:HEAT repeat protein